jgi:probable phosphoglycerate mutase
MRLLLIRHGETTDNIQGILGTTIPGPVLTELGRSQADAVPGALAGERIEAIYISTMQRTAQTAEPLARATGLVPEVIDGIQEITAGDFEGHNDKEAIQGYIGAVISWWHDSAVRVPGGEDGAEFFARFDAAIAAITARHDGTVAVFSHGAAIRTWASWAAVNIDETYSRAHGLGNTGIVVLEGSPAEGWRGVSWEDEPVGGEQLADAAALDPAGEPF